MRTPGYDTGEVAGKLAVRLRVVHERTAVERMTLSLGRPGRDIASALPLLLMREETFRNEEPR